jgi:hypothetical protein
VGLQVRTRCNRFASVPIMVFDLNRVGDSRGTMDSLTATAATRRRLLDALLAEALAPAEDRELEAAE